MIGATLSYGDPRTASSRYKYTGEGWLQHAELSDGTVSEYMYDGTARRSAKTVNGQRTEYYWDGVHLLGERTDGSTIDYLFMPGSFFLMGMTHDGQHYSYVFDQLGTPTELIDPRGEIAWAADYSAYGEIVGFRVNDVSQPFRFLGQYYDDELGWHYNRHRYYHPVTGHFTCPDPLGIRGRPKPLRLRSKPGELGRSVWLGFRGAWCWSNGYVRGPVELRLGQKNDERGGEKDERRERCGV